jgi:hypothetical protein
VKSNTILALVASFKELVAIMAAISYYAPHTISKLILAVVFAFLISIFAFAHPYWGQIILSFHSLKLSIL